MKHYRTIALCDKSAAEQFAPWQRKAIDEREEAFTGPRAPADGLTGLQYLEQNMTPIKRALADAEWFLSDERGQLPADWPEQRAAICAQFGEVDCG